MGDRQELSGNRNRPLVWTALGLALGLPFLLALFPIQSFDVWWHLRTGQLILESGSIPRADPYTYTAYGRPWVTHEWLAEVLFHLVHRLGGIDLLVLFKAVLAGLALGLSAWAAWAGLPFGRRREILPFTALGLLLAAPLLATRAFVRPHLLTAVFLGLLLLLLQMERRTGRRVYLWILPPLFLLWANLHSGFVLGLGLAALYWLGEGLGRNGDREEGLAAASHRYKAGILVLAAAATLINPNQAEAFLYPFRLVSRAEVTGSIVELRSIFHPAYHGALFLYALGFAVLLGAAAVLRAGGDSRRRVPWEILLPSLVFLALAIRSLRGVSEFAVLVPVLLGVHGPFLIPQAWRTRWILPAAVAVLALASAAAVWVWGVPMGEDGRRRVGLGVEPANRPAAAAEFLRRAGLERASLYTDGQAPGVTQAEPGRIFNILPFGGYFIFELWPQEKVFVDGRLDVFPDGFLTGYTRLMETGEGWRTLVRQYGIELAAVDYAPDPAADRGLRRLLREDPEWACVFFGDNALVYARKVPQNEALLSRFGGPFDPSLRSLESLRQFLDSAGEEDKERQAAALREMVALAPEEIAPARILSELLLDLGRPGEAAAQLRRVWNRNPHDQAAGLLLAGAVAQSEGVPAGLAILDEVLRVHPRSADAWILRADLTRAQGRMEDAKISLENAVRLDPDSYLGHLRLGILRAQSGEPEPARKHFQEALRIRPGDPGALRNLGTLRTMQGQQGQQGQ